MSSRPLSSRQRLNHSDRSYNARDLAEEFSDAHTANSPVRVPSNRHTTGPSDSDEPPPYHDNEDDEGNDDDQDEDGEGGEAIAVEQNGTHSDDEEEIAYRPMTEAEKMLEVPLDEEEQGQAARYAQEKLHLYDANVRFVQEFMSEQNRVEWFLRDERKNKPETFDYFIQLGPVRLARAHRDRSDLIVRRNIKRRWQKLGVWNPDWKFAYCGEWEKPIHNTADWRWRWQQDDAASEWNSGSNPMGENPNHPIVRALRLREGLRRSDHSPVLPRHNLQNSSSADQAESFIMSRPWFVHGLELSEETARRHATGCSPELSVEEYVFQAWKRRGDLKPAWGTQSMSFEPGWKWPHESPSPEPENLSGLHDLATFELNPSEADELEAIPSPTPSPPPPPQPKSWILTGKTGIFGPERIPVYDETYVKDTRSIEEIWREEDEVSASHSRQRVYMPQQRSRVSTNSTVHGERVSKIDEEDSEVESEADAGSEADSNESRSLTGAPEGHARRMSNSIDGITEIQLTPAVTETRKRGRPPKLHDLIGVDKSAAVSPPAKKRKRGHPPKTVDSTGMPELPTAPPATGRRGRGRPSKPVKSTSLPTPQTIPPATVRRGRGRPSKALEAVSLPEPPVAPPASERRGRGRPSMPLGSTSVSDPPVASPMAEKRGRGRPPKPRDSTIADEPPTPATATGTRRGKPSKFLKSLGTSEPPAAQPAAQKRGRGRPPKQPRQNNADEQVLAAPPATETRMRGRPPKAQTSAAVDRHPAAPPATETRTRGRPSKTDNYAGVSKPAASPSKRGRGRPRQN